MRNYQRKNKYKLPHNVYMQTLYFIKDYYRLKEEADRILHASPSLSTDVVGKGKGAVSNPTEDKALRIAEINEKLAIIEGALEMIPEEYRKGVFNNVVKKDWFPIDAAVRTYQYQKQKFIYYCAQKIKIK